MYESKAALEYERIVTFNNAHMYVKISDAKNVASWEISATV
jgi:hypothetical protein